LEKLARRFELGSEINKEIEYFFNYIIPNIIYSGVPEAMSTPNSIIHHEDIPFSFPTDEFKEINGIHDHLLADTLTVNICPALSYVSDPNNVKVGGLYDTEEKVILSYIFFDYEDILSQEQFVAKVKDIITTSIKHEILHFINDMGDFDKLYKDRKKTKKRRYINPEEDFAGYQYQHVELENHMSDFHDAVLGNIFDLLNRIPRSVNFILNAHKLPDGTRKRKALSRLYSTIREMDDHYKNNQYETIANKAKRVLISALRNDEAGTNQQIKELYDIAQKELG